MDEIYIYSYYEVFRMKRKWCAWPFFLVILLLGPVLSVLAQDNRIAPIRATFKGPPPDCRIMMRWWWFGPSATKPEIERELRVMKQAGIGGVELQPVYPLVLDGPKDGQHNYPYLSDEFIETLRFAADKARELGLRFDLTLGSGWPFGGPHIPVTQAAGKLRVVSVPVTPEIHSVPVPDVGEGEKILAAFLAGPEDGTKKAPKLIDPREIRDGRLLLPSGRNASGTILWFIASRTGMMVKRPAIGAEGFVLDHMDRNAIENHLHAVGDRLMTAFGPSPPDAAFSDSLEAYGSDWTNDLLEEFRKRRGYGLTPYLPALVQGIGPETNDIRHDWGRTLTELVNERYLSPIQQWAAQHNTRFRSQTYGVPAVTLSSNQLVDLPEGEGHQWKSFSTTRWASSASHLYGRNVTSVEAWTWLHSPSFRATPLDLKAEADLFFLQGANQLIGHGWPYSPSSVPKPGWRFYAAAALNDHNPWWAVMPSVAGYLQRVSYVLRLGGPANDVAVLLPTDDAWSQFTAGKVSVSQNMERLIGPDLVTQVLDAGFNFDFVDAESIDAKAAQHQVLVLPNIEGLPLKTYKAIEADAKNGKAVIAVGKLPSRAPGLRESAMDTAAVREITEELFRTPNGKGHAVPDEHKLGALLSQLSIPDVTFGPPRSELGAVHRKLPFADIYFLANTSNQPIHVKAKFRSARRYVERWDPFSGNVSPIGKNVPLDLGFQPYESTIIVFTDSMSGPTPRPARKPSDKSKLPDPIDLRHDWTITFADVGLTFHVETLHSWSDEEAMRFYSGTAAYEKDIELPAAFMKSGRAVYLDFGPGTPVEFQPTGRIPVRAWLEGPVREAARVFVNSQIAGDIWKPPYEVNITKLMHPGKNHLKIEVGNLAINEMAGRALPDYRLLNSRYGERFLPQDMENLQPLPSGILGPLQLVVRHDH